jgi:hypothetical protein
MTDWQIFTIAEKNCDTFSTLCLHRPHVWPRAFKTFDTFIRTGKMMMMMEFDRKRKANRRRKKYIYIYTHQPRLNPKHTFCRRVQVYRFIYYVMSLM